jgi:hypothetical protein
LTILAIAQWGAEFRIGHAANNEARGKRAFDGILQFAQRAPVDLMHSAPARMRGGQDMADITVSRFWKDGAGQGFLNVYPAIPLEGPVAGIEMSASNLVAVAVRQRVGSASQISLGVTKRLWRILGARTTSSGMTSCAWTASLMS